MAIAGPMIPPARHGGRKRSVNVREILNGIFYVLSTGCQWQALPKDLPPKSTAHHYFMLWDSDGTLERIHHALYALARLMRMDQPAYDPRQGRFRRALASHDGEPRIRALVAPKASI